MSEDQLQASCWQWAWNTYPQTRRLLWAVPNGGNREIKVAIVLQATGVIAGVHDLHFLWQGVLHTFELKVNGNELTEDRVVLTGSGRTKVIFGQREWAVKMREQGGLCWCIKELEQFKLILRLIVTGEYDYIKTLMI